jgi:hypothetical protein
MNRLRLCAIASNARSAALLIGLIAVILLTGGRVRAAPEQAATRIRVVSNAGQHPAEVRFTAALGGATAWLTDDAVWLTYTEYRDGGLSGTHFRLDFGVALAWNPFTAGGDEVCIIFAGPSGAETLRPRTWAGARAALGEGIDLVLSETGLSIAGNPDGLAALTVTGGPVEIRSEAGAAVIRAGDQVLPLRWSVPVTVNGAPAGAHGGPAVGGTTQAGETAPAGAGQLLFSTFIGSESWDEGEAIERDAAGNVYVAGQTLSIFFPAAPGPFTAQHNVEAFLARLNGQGTALDFICVIRADVEDWGTALAVDALGNAVLFGRTDSVTNFPVTPGAYDTTPNGGFDLFVMKFDPVGQLVFSTLLGGSENEYAGDVAIAPDGTLVMAGSTASGGSAGAGFPTTVDAYQSEHSGERDIFVAALSADGAALEYGTFIGGAGNDHAEALALHGPAAVVGGWSASADFDATAGGYDTTLAGAFDGVLLSLIPGSASLNFWTFLGGSDDGITSDRILAVGVGAGGDVFVSGSTYAADFPATPGAFDTTFDGACLCSDGFVARFSSDGTGMVWATFLGAGGDDIVEGLQLDALGRPALTGSTGSADFPVTGDAPDSTLDGLSDAFIARLDADGAALPFATYLGGSAEEAGLGIDVSSRGLVFLTGWSNSADYPTTPGSYDPDPNPDKDVIVTALILPALEVFLPVILR